MQTNIFKTKSNSIKLGLAGVAAAVALIAPTVANADSYTVQSGDTLSEIAVTYNTTVEKLASVNQIADVDFITVGQILELDPEATVASVETSAEAAAPAANSAETAQLQHQLKQQLHHHTHQTWVLQMLKLKKSLLNANQVVATQLKTVNTMVVTN